MVFNKLYSLCNFVKETLEHYSVTRVFSSNFYVITFGHFGDVMYW